MRRLLPSLGWLLLGLLAIAATLISAGHREADTDPAADSYAPAGTAALFALLQQKGYSPDIDRRLHPELGPGDVAIAFTSDVRDEAEQAKEKDADQSLEIGVKNGATVFWLPVPGDFEAASRSAAAPTPALRPDGQTRLISNEQAGYRAPDGITPLLQAHMDALSWAVNSGKGYEVFYSDGIGLTNRFLDQGQNAQALLEILEAFAQPHARVLFTTATFGKGNDQGLLRTIGAWAEAAWYQLIFLFLVIIYTLNQRFGLPDHYRVTQKGARELLDAIADIYTRAKASGPALEAAAHRTDSLLRSVLKVPTDAGEGELNRLLPEALMIALTHVRAASQIPRTRPKDALALINRLEDETNRFLSDKRPNEAAIRKRRAA